MSEELVDLRAKITRQTNLMLEAHSRANNCTKAESARDLFHELAQKRLHESIIAARLMVGEGYVGAVEGIKGKVS